jgi:hypothetical protein
MPLPVCKIKMIRLLVPSHYRRNTHTHTHTHTHTCVGGRGGGGLAGFHTGSHK